MPDRWGRVAGRGDAKGDTIPKEKEIAKVVVLPPNKGHRVCVNHGVPQHPTWTWYPWKSCQLEWCPNRGVAHWNTPWEHRIPWWAQATGPFQRHFEWDGWEPHGFGRQLLQGPLWGDHQNGEGPVGHFPHWCPLRQPGSDGNGQLAGGGANCCNPYGECWPHHVPRTSGGRVEGDERIRGCGNKAREECDAAHAKETEAWKQAIKTGDPKDPVMHLLEVTCRAAHAQAVRAVDAFLKKIKETLCKHVPVSTQGPWLWMPWVPPFNSKWACGRW